MPRKSFQVNHTAQQIDTLYKSRLVRLFVNQMIKNGKSRLAHRLLYTAIDMCSTSQEDGVQVLSKAVVNVTPQIEVRPQRIGGSVYQVPMKVSADRGTTLAIRWLVTSARTRPGRSMSTKLATEFADAAKQTGNAIRKRDDMQRMAEANKAFAHLART
jgi:small subunit ribosomal protein S7